MSERVDRLPLGERVLDRFNPILVREIQQAVSGRAFLITVSVSLTCVVLVAMLIAWGDSGTQIGREAFIWTLRLFTPVAIFFVPLQAFISTRHEVSGGTAEHLLLTRLRPGAIVRGKLFAAMVQFIVFVSLFAPLMALTFLLRGVDVPTIAVLLALGCLGCLCATSFAILLGAGSSSERYRALPYSLLTVILGGATLAIMSGMDDLHRGVEMMVRTGNTMQALGVLSFPVVGLLALFALGSTSALKHAHENRSTPFRLLAFAGLVGAYFWIGLSAPRGAADDFAPAVAAVATIFFFLFWLMAVTEDERLSPRMRTLVPRRAFLATVSTPFLPGGGRGLIFAWLIGAVTFIGMVFYLAYAGVAADPDTLGIAVMAWEYTLLFAALARLLRSRFPAGPRGTKIARITFTAALVVLWIVPPVLETMLGGRMRGWNELHILNPFWTMAAHDQISEQGIIQKILGAMCFFATVLALPSMGRGFAEVREASRARRRSAA